MLSPGAAAWAWPVDGPVLRPFISEGDPYAGGQHRGIDIGAPTGSDVRSAARGVVAFAGRLPRQGLCLTVRTEDGWSVTLVHLGSIGVPVGTQVSEGDVVGTIGPSGEPEGTEPYVYLGIRLTADPNGYVDPLTLLPPRQAPEQVPPVQQTSPVQAPAPPVAARHAGPSRSAPRRRHAAAAKARVPQRSAATPRPRDSAWACEPDAEAAVPLSAGSARSAFAVPSASRSCAELARSTFRGAPDTSAGAAGASCRRGRARRHNASCDAGRRSAAGSLEADAADPARHARPRTRGARRRRSASPAAGRPASVRPTAPP